MSKDCRKIPRSKMNRRGGATGEVGKVVTDSEPNGLGRYVQECWASMRALSQARIQSGHTVAATPGSTGPGVPFLSTSLIQCPHETI